MTTKVKIIGGLFVAGLILAPLIWFFTRPDTEGPRTITAEPSTIVQDVEFTGRLAANQHATLGFELSGTISELLVGEGEFVTAGQALAKLDTTVAQLEVAKAQADQLSAAEQKLITLRDAQDNAADTKELNDQTLAKKRQAVRDAKAELDQARAVRQQTHQESGESATSETSLATVKTKEAAYHAAQESLTETERSVTKGNTSADNAVKVARAQYLATIQAAGNATGLSSLQALSAISSATLSKNTITAPFDGVITEQHLEVGEIALAGTPVIAVATTNQVELVADVTETDAAKIRRDMTATVSFDALPPHEQWSATVTYIAPAARIVEGVPTFEIKLTIDTASDERLKPGLTTNLTVHAAKKVDVLAIPRRAVSTRGDQQFVSLLAPDGTISEVEVNTGLIGSDGRIEIISGISAGQQIILDPTS